ncbi:MAG TPA: hypothetical protein VGA75_01000 [Paracoccaceae bacterium]
MLRFLVILIALVSVLAFGWGAAWSYSVAQHDRTSHMTADGPPAAPADCAAATGDHDRTAADCCVAMHHVQPLLSPEAVISQPVFLLWATTPGLPDRLHAGRGTTPEKAPPKTI